MADQQAQGPVADAQHPDEEHVLPEAPPTQQQHDLINALNTLHRPVLPVGVDIGRYDAHTLNYATPGDGGANDPSYPTAWIDQQESQALVALKVSTRAAVLGVPVAEVITDALCVVITQIQDMTPEIRAKVVNDIFLAALITLRSAGNPRKRLLNNLPFEYIVDNAAGQIAPSYEVWRGLTVDEDVIKCVLAVRRGFPEGTPAPIRLAAERLVGRGWTALQLIVLLQESQLSRQAKIALGRIVTGYKAEVIAIVQCLRWISEGPSRFYTAFYTGVPMNIGSRRYWTLAKVAASVLNISTLQGYSGGFQKLVLSPSVETLCSTIRDGLTLAVMPSSDANWVAVFERAAEVARERFLSNEDANDGGHQDQAAGGNAGNGPPPPPGAGQPPQGGDQGPPGGNDHGGNPPDNGGHGPHGGGGNDPPGPDEPHDGDGANDEDPHNEDAENDQAEGEQEENVGHEGIPPPNAQVPNHDAPEVVADASRSLASSAVDGERVAPPAVEQAGGNENSGRIQESPIGEHGTTGVPRPLSFFDKGVSGKVDDAAVANKAPSQTTQEEEKERGGTKSSSPSPMATETNIKQVLSAAELAAYKGGVGAGAASATRVALAPGLHTTAIRPPSQKRVMKRRPSTGMDFRKKDASITFPPTPPSVDTMPKETPTAKLPTSDEILKELNPGSDSSIESIPEVKPLALSRDQTPTK